MEWGLMTNLRAGNAGRVIWAGNLLLKTVANEISNGVLEVLPTGQSKSKGKKNHAHSLLSGLSGP